MKLTVMDRLVLLNILPNEGSIVTLRVVRDLRGELSFSEDEIAALNLRDEDERARWRSDADPNKDVPVGATATEVIRSAFQNLDKQGRMTLDFLPTYEKFEAPA